MASDHISSRLAHTPPELDLLFGAWAREAKGIAAIGLSKNSGKTTALNALLRLGQGSGKLLGLLSTGLDGEERDLVYGFAKPRVIAPRGSLVLTSAIAASIASGITTIRDTGLNSVFGELVIARAGEDAAVVLHGPRTVSELHTAIGALRDEGAELVLVDGSMGRRAAARPDVVDGIVLAIGAAYEASEVATLKQAGHLVHLMSLPIWDGLQPALHLKGALKDTDLLAGQLEGRRVVVLDPSRVLVEAKTLETFLRRGGKLEVKARPRLLCLVSNPFVDAHRRLDPAEWHHAVHGLAPNLAAVDLHAALFTAPQLCWEHL